VTRGSENADCLVMLETLLGPGKLQSSEDDDEDGQQQQDNA
jgi:hypothetical protein